MDLVREVRDLAFYAATIWKRSAVVQNIRLSLSGLSPRMRYVLCNGYETDDAALATQFLDPSDKVLELGSSVGFVAIHCLKNIGIGNVAMVEANPTLLPNIIENFRLNGLKDPRIHNVAVGPVDGEIAFGVSRNSWSSSVYRRAEEVQRITVPQKTIASIIEEVGFVPNVLIVDIEGYEVELPASHFLPFEKVIIEIHPKIVGREKTDRLLDDLTNVGFVIAETAGASLCLRKLPIAEHAAD